MAPTDSSPAALVKIAAFIRDHHVLTLATSREGFPYAAPLFYAYDAQRNRFVFASDAGTEHARQMLENPTVAAGIYLETDAVGKLQGLQCIGRVIPAEEADKKIYFERFPFARVLKPCLWCLKPAWMKLTDNRLGFGKKLIWEATGDLPA
jgi:uncharacterized protein